MTNDINITIGSDPEFVIMCGDKIENALEIFTRLQEPDYCCECNHPNEEDIQNIYDFGERDYYLKEALEQIAQDNLVKIYNEILEDYQELKVVIKDKKHLIKILIEFYTEINEISLSNLPSDIYDNIFEQIVDEYETDCSSCEIDSESYFCSTELGCDGQSILGEMRPKYGNNPIEHFNEILRLMEQLNDMLAPEIICYGSDELQVKAGSIASGISQTYELGGHIHIGYDDLHEKFLGISEYVQRNIPNFLAIYIGIPLTLIEYTSEAIKRHRSYGGFAASHNGEKYFGTEFIMPSSWLVSPEITIGALSLAYVVAYEYIKVMLSGEDTYRNIDFDLKIEKLKKLYDDCLSEKYSFGFLEKEMPKLYSEIKKMELYPEYKDEIDTIFDMIEKNKTWESDTNILPRWAQLW